MDEAGRPVPGLHLRGRQSLRQDVGRKEAVEMDHGDHQPDEEVAEVVHTEKDIVLPRSNKQRRSMRNKRKKKSMLRKSRVKMKSMPRNTTKKETMKKSRPHKMMRRRSLRRQRATRLALRRNDDSWAVG